MDTTTTPCHEVAISQSETVKVRVAANGRIVIPAPIREGLGIRAGDELLLAREGSTIRICTYEQAVRRAQELVTRFVSAGAGVE
jgi:AbrB family looped-hinge helix DNA binding protein